MPELDYSEAFSSQNDLFSRKGLAIQLENIISNSEDDSLVIGLDDNWGSGKTTFLKMWQQKIIDDGKFKIVYYDSFQNDFQSDPFISISAEIYKLIDDKKSELKDKFIEATKKVGATLLKTSLKIGVTLATAGVVQGSALDGFKDDITSSINEPIEKLIEKKLIDKEKEDLTLSHFKETLEEIGREKN